MSMTLHLSYPCSSVVHILDWLYLQIPEPVPHANLGFKDNMKAHHLSFHFSASNPLLVLISASHSFNCFLTDPWHVLLLHLFSDGSTPDTNQEMNFSYCKQCAYLWLVVTLYHHFVACPVLFHIQILIQNQQSVKLMPDKVLMVHLKSTYSVIGLSSRHTFL